MTDKDPSKGKKKKDWTHRRGGAHNHAPGTRQEQGHVNRSTTNNRPHSNASANGHGQAHATEKFKRARYNDNQRGLSRSGQSSQQSRGHHGRGNHRPDRIQSHSSSSTLAPTSTSTTQAASATADGTPAIREIPGFFYDPEKKKYFKITANHTLGSQHPFSQQSIREKTTPKPVLDPIRYQTGPRFPKTMTHYRRLGWYLQDRELGIAGNPRRQLCDMHAMLVRRWKRNRRVEPTLAENGGTYTFLEIDPVLNDLYMGSRQRELWRYHISENALETKYQWMNLNGASSDLSSLHLTPDNYLITTYLGDMGRSGTLHIQRGPMGAPWSRDPRTSTLALYPLMKSNVWTSAVNRDMIALGADQKVVVISDWETTSLGEPTSGGLNTSRSSQTLWTGSDVFTLTIEPQGHQNVVYAGCRNGSVKIFDLNQPGTFTSGPDPKEHLPFMREKRAKSILEGIGHRESSIQSLRRVGEHYLVTGATNGEISMWDKRFVGVGGSTGNQSKGGDRHTKSVLDFRGKVQDQFSKVRLDINMEDTLLAADNLDHRVSLWSIKTGERLKDLEVKGPAVSSLKFSPDQQGIWVAVGDRVQFWGLGTSNVD